jgi:hypothetical protein
MLMTKLLKCIDQIVAYDLIVAYVLMLLRLIVREITKLLHRPNCCLCPYVT